MENTKENIPVIGIAQVLQMLKNGKTREEIRVHYSITKTDLGLLFKHPALIGKKTIKAKTPAFTIVEDEVVVEEIVVEEVETIKIVEDEKPQPAIPVSENDVQEPVEEIEEKEDAKSTWV
jgi:hypothetical protein